MEHSPDNEEVNALIEILADERMDQQWNWAHRSLLKLASETEDQEEKGEFLKVLEGRVDWHGRNTQARFEELEAAVKDLWGL